MSIKDYPTSRQLKAELDKKKLESIYLFTGEEEGEKEKFIARIADILFHGRDATDQTVRRFHLENGEFEAAADFALSSSMFSDKKVCVMYHIESLPAAKTGLPLLRELIETLPDSTTLVMTSGENRVPGTLSPDLLKRAKVVHFWKYFLNDIKGYIVKTLQREGITLEERSVSLLVELMGRDMARIDGALDRIRNLGEKGLVSYETVLFLIEDQRSITLYDFTGALFRKDRSAFSLLPKLITDEVPELVILAAIVRLAEQIEKYHVLILQGLSVDQALRDAGVSTRGKDDFLEQAGKNSLEEIRKLFPLVYRTDFCLKNNSYSKKIVANPLMEFVTDLFFRKKAV